MNVYNLQNHHVIQEAINVILQGEEHELSDVFSNSFNTTVLKKEVGLKKYVEIFKKLQEAIPDLKVEVEDLIMDGDIFKAKLKVTGTHKNEMKSLKRGWHNMKATDTKINKVVSSIEVSLKGNKVDEIKHIDENNGFVSGLLRELDLLPKSYN
jgi:predicted ester cyclase